jgi:hypothetical protein
MKIHPTFSHMMDAFKTALDPISPPYWREYAVGAHKAWREADRPVVENESADGPRCSYGGMHPRCDHDERTIEKLSAELAAANAFKSAVVNALNPIRPGDDATFWGKDLGEPKVVSAAIEAMRMQRNTANANIAELEERLAEALDRFKSLSEVMWGNTDAHIRNMALEDAAMVVRGLPEAMWDATRLKIIEAIRGLKK